MEKRFWNLEDRRGCEQGQKNPEKGGIVRLIFEGNIFFVSEYFFLSYCLLQKWFQGFLEFYSVLKRVFFLVGMHGGLTPLVWYHVTTTELKAKWNPHNSSPFSKAPQQQGERGGGWGGVENERPIYFDTVHCRIVFGWVWRERGVVRAVWEMDWLGKSVVSHLKLQNYFSI